ncbi:MAG: hypothetical protein OXH52_19910 [Gammaproteobacteria bacterium]|nr:hypothetical protein [Gammaproteobacteria bacterium]
MAEVEKKLLDNCAHLGGIVAARSISSEEQLGEEEESLNKRDVFGRTIKYEYWREGDEGPFVHFIRELAKDLPKDAVTFIGSTDGDMIGSYHIADDTLRAVTGISEEEELGKRLFDCIRYGEIDFAECLRVKRNGNEESYRQWLSEELSRAQEETRRRLQDFLGRLPVAISESDAAGNRSGT